MQPTDRTQAVKLSPKSSGKRIFRLCLASFILAVAGVLTAPSISWGHAFLTQPITLTVRDQVVAGSAAVPVSEFVVPNSAPGVSVLVAARESIAIWVNGDQLEIRAAWLDSHSKATEKESVSLAFVTEAFVGDLGQIEMRWSFASQSRQVLLQTNNASMLANLDEDDSVSFAQSFWASGWSYFSQGIRHIVFGLDHLLFLVVLGLGLFKVSLDRKSAYRAVVLVGAFTLGHALSFSLAYFGLLSLSGRFVEPVIALSIFVAALGALAKWQWEKYWVIATLIGLVHGLGFASSLAQMGLATSLHAPAIVAFNLGIDLAQTCVIALTAFSLFLVRWYLPSRQEILRRLALVSIATLALFWTVTRTITG